MVSCVKMRKIQGALTALLLITSILTSMPLAHTQETNEKTRQEQTFITEFNGSKLKNPVPIAEFFSDFAGKRAKQQGKQEREEKKSLTIEASQASKKKEIAERGVRSLFTQSQDPYINITFPPNGTNFAWDNQTQTCNVSIRWITNSTQQIERFTIDWALGEGRNETQVIENGSVRMATHTYTYYRANHTIRLTVVDGRRKRDSDAVLIKDSIPSPPSLQAFVDLLKPTWSTNDVTQTTIE